MTSTSKTIYNDSLSLLTDFYQLSMAYAWWKQGSYDIMATYHLVFRKNPFDGGYAIACGLNQFIEIINSWHFVLADLEALAKSKVEFFEPLQDKKFLEYLQNLKSKISLKAIPDGSIVFANEPIIQVKAPIILGQILESIALNIFGYETLIATKASRIKYVSGNDKVLEFGLRRAHGFDGALSASYAAYIGGCDATSNTLAAIKYDIPLEGTIAHSFIMSFASEEEAFKAYAQTFPKNTVFLVDTYNSLNAVRKLVKLKPWFDSRQYNILGIRLDSGDLAYLSIEARKILDEANLTDTKIIASNDLDEHIIYSLKQQNAKIDAWGVGTKLVTAYDQPALGAVYKLSAVSKNNQDWDYKLKLSEQTVKISNPGILDIKRFFNTNNNLYTADMIYDQYILKSQANFMIDPEDFTRRREVKRKNEIAFDLLKPIFVEGKLVYESPSIHEIKQYVVNEMQRLHDSTKRLLNPHRYPVGLEEELYNLKTHLILKARGLEA